MKYLTVVGLMIWLILGTGLTAAGTLTVSLSPSLDGNGTIEATSITEALLSRYYGFFDPFAVVIIRSGKISNVSRDSELEDMEQTEKTLNLSNNESVSWGCDFKIRECSYEVVKSPNRPYNAAIITNGTAQFNLSDEDAGDRYIMINNLYVLIPTRIDDPTKDIHQFVGEKLRVSVIGNLSDPTYRIKTFTIGQGYDNPTVSYYDPTNLGVLGIFSGNVYVILSLKTNPQKFQVITLGIPHTGRGMTIIDFTPTASIHPSTSTSVNPSFSKWVFGKGSHGDDYGGNDSKCSICHGDLDTKPSKFSEITVNNGFCFRCHYGKGGSDKGFVVDTIGLGIGTPAPTAAKPTATTAKPTAAPTTPTPKAPAFGALSAILALLAVLLIKRK